MKEDSSGRANAASKKMNGEARFVRRVRKKFTGIPLLFFRPSPPATPPLPAVLEPRGSTISYPVSDFVGDRVRRCRRTRKLHSATRRPVDRAKVERVSRIAYVYDLRVSWRDGSARLAAGIEHRSAGSFGEIIKSCERKRTRRRIFRGTGRKNARG